MKLAKIKFVEFKINCDFNHQLKLFRVLGYPLIWYKSQHDTKVHKFKISSTLLKLKYLTS